MWLFGQSVALLLAVITGETVSDSPPPATPTAEYNLTVSPQQANLTSPIVIQLQILLPDTRKKTDISHRLKSSSAGDNNPATEPDFTEYFIIGLDNTSNSSYPELESCETCTIYDINDVYMTIHRNVPQHAPFKPRAECTVTVSEVTSILETITKFTNGEIENQQSDVMNATMNACQKALRETRTTVLKLIELFKAMKAHDAHSITAEVYQKTVNDYNTQIKKFREQIEFLERQTEQDSRTKLDELNKAKQSFERQYEDVKRKLDQEILDHQKDLAELIGNEIQNGKYTAAGIKYLSLRDKSRIPEIVLTGYSAQTIPNFIIFCQTQLKNETEISILMIALVDTIWERKDAESPNVILLDSYINKRCKSSFGNDRLRSLLEKLRAAVAKVISIWTNNIEMGQYSSVVAFVNSKDTLIYDYFDKLCKNVWNRFVDKKNGPGEKILQNYIQFSKSLNRNHGLQVRAKIFRYLYLRNQAGDGPSNVHIALQLATVEYQKSGKSATWWKDIPTHWKSIIKGEFVCLWDSFQRYQVYIKSNRDNDRGWVYGTEWKDYDKWTVSYRWIFHSRDDGDRWGIKNDLYGDYMYAASDGFSYDAWRRAVFTWRKHEQVSTGYWKLEERAGTRWENNRFLLLNDARKEYLAIDHHEEGNTGFRAVFTYRQTRFLSDHLHEFSIRPCQ